MSGPGRVWYNYKVDAICFEPETDKDYDRLQELLEDLREAGYGDRLERTAAGFSHIWKFELKGSDGL